MNCVYFVDNTFVWKFWQLCWTPLSFLLLDQLTMDKKDSDGFFSRRLVCRTSNRSYNLAYNFLCSKNCSCGFRGGGAWGAIAPLPLGLDTESVLSELLACCTGMMLLPSESHSLFIIQTISVDIISWVDEHKWWSTVFSTCLYKLWLNVSI